MERGGTPSMPSPKSATVQSLEVVKNNLKILYIPFLSQIIEVSEKYLIENLSN